MEQVEALLERCNWPALPAPYDRALREAVRFILERYPQVEGIVASGSIVRGAPAPSSDLDIYVVHGAAWRQRVQRIFHGVPAEIFVNPPAQIRRYFVEERQAGRPITAHMWSTGHPVLALTPQVGSVQAEARAVLQQPPDYSPEHVTTTRYMAALLYEDAGDVAETDPETGLLILGRAVPAMLHYRFIAANQYLPRDKDLLRALEALDAPLARLARAYYCASQPAARFELAARLAEQTLATHGFFEWESEPEELNDPDE